METQLSQAISAVSRELGSLAKLTESLQDHLSVAGVSEQHVVDMQALDWLTQSLTCLESFLGHVHTQILLGSGEIPGHVFESVCLSRLRDSLRGNPADNPSSLNQDCEMF